MTTSGIPPTIVVDEVMVGELPDRIRDRGALHVDAHDDLGVDQKRARLGDGHVLGLRKRIEHPLEVVLPREPGDQARHRHQEDDDPPPPPPPRSAPQQQRRRKGGRERDRGHQRRRAFQHVGQFDAAGRLRAERVDGESGDEDHGDRRGGGEEENRPEETPHPGIVQRPGRGGTMHDAEFTTPIPGKPRGAWDRRHLPRALPKAPANQRRGLVA